MTETPRSRRRVLRPLLYAATILAAAALLSIHKANAPAGPKPEDLARAANHAAQLLTEAGLLQGWRTSITTQTNPPLVRIDATPLDPDNPPSMPTTDASAAALATLTPPATVRLTWSDPNGPATTQTVTPRP